MEIEDVESSMVGEKVSLEGEIRDYSYYNRNSFFRLEGSNSSLKAVQFDAGKQLEDGEKVEVEGEIAVYQGELEIIADSVETR